MVGVDAWCKVGGWGGGGREGELRGKRHGGEDGVGSKGQRKERVGKERGRGVLGGRGGLGGRGVRGRRGGGGDGQKEKDVELGGRGR